MKDNGKILIMISDGMRCYVVSLSRKDRLYEVFKQARKLNLYDHRQVFMNGVEIPKENFSKTLKELGINENVSIKLR